MHCWFFRVGQSFMWVINRSPCSYPNHFSHEFLFWKTLHIFGPEKSEIYKVLQVIYSVRVIIRNFSFSKNKIILIRMLMLSMFGNYNNFIISYILSQVLRTKRPNYLSNIINLRPFASCLLIRICQTCIVGKYQNLLATDKILNNNFLTLLGL